MGMITEAEVADLLAKLAIFGRDYPTSPCVKAAITLRHLGIACTRLRRLAASPKRSGDTQRLPPRKRRRGPKHPFGTPAHIRIMANIEVRNDTGCWIWLGSGTGRHGSISSERTKNDYVHRVMYEHANGRVLEAGQVVRHTCDNGYCCNPDHLIIGTQKENAQDTIARNRSFTQKITQDEAKDVLIRRYEGESLKVLAIEYGMSESGIAIIGSQSFSDLNNDPDVKAVKDGKRAARKLTRNDVGDIRRRVAAGEKYEQIAASYGITEGYVANIANGRRWRYAD
jgi:hypothetical protein